MTLKSIIIKYISKGAVIKTIRRIINSHPSFFKLTFEVTKVNINVKRNMGNSTNVNITAVLYAIITAGMLPELRKGFKINSLGSYNWKVKNKRRVYPPNQSIPDKTHKNKKILASLESFSINYQKIL